MRQRSGKELSENSYKDVFESVECSLLGEASLCKSSECPQDSERNRRNKKKNKKKRRKKEEKKKSRKNKTLIKSRKEAEEQLRIIDDAEGE